jgi:uncharacterized membrane protein YedE/YeeE
MNFIEPLIGGALIGLGSLLAMAASGKIPGISGIVARLIRPKSGDISWRVLFLVGLIAGAGATLLFNIGWQGYALPSGRGLAVIGVAGLLVGFGTRMGGGCTSGHGVCGMGAGAKDALVYTLIFMAAGIGTVFVWNLIMEGVTGA